jgi:hypothetical protein
MPILKKRLKTGGGAGHGRLLSADGAEDTCLEPGLSVRFAVCLWPGLIVHGLFNGFKHAVPGADAGFSVGDRVAA